MKAVVLERARTLRNYDLAPPKPIAGEVLVRVSECCVTDDDLDAFAEGRGRLPRIYGSTAVGTVESVPRDTDAPQILQFHSDVVAMPEPGDLVAVEFGEEEDGAFREFLSIGPGRCNVLSPEIPTERLALIPDLARAAGALAFLGVEPQQTLIVYGARSRGVLLAVAAERAGIQTVLVDPVQARLSNAEELGIGATINPIVASLPEELEWVSGGRVDYIVDTTGDAEILPSALAIAQPGTTLAFAERIEWEIPIRLVVEQGLSLTGLSAARADYAAAESLVEGIELDRLVSLRVPFSELPLAVPTVFREHGTFLRLVGYSG